MWLLLAVLSTLFIGVSSILSKIGIKDADPYVTGAVTNTVLLAAFAVTAAFTESFGQVQDMGFGTWVSVDVYKRQAEEKSEHFNDFNHP